jgi:sterol desaturase/sphingolipid hydroxylase (fatty acid hydroxylase superfamily)
MLDRLKAATPFEAGQFFLLANVAIFTGSRLLGRLFQGRRIFDRWEPMRPLEIAAALSSVALNASVSIAGWWLWTKGLVVLRPGGFATSLLDCFLMVRFMDFGMYVFHRLAHHPRWFGLVHRFHHRHETTNPISLFVLHPLEVAGFGGLMIAFLVLYPMTFGGLVAYLSLNVLFGTLGHSGVEPFPRNLRSVPLLRLIGTSTFHAEHHEHPKYNFGFYTLFWDKLFGTLDPEYTARFIGKDDGVE